MYNRLFKSLFSVVLLVCHAIVGAQDCSLSVDGLVHDEGTGLPLAFVNVLVQETLDGVVTDEAGAFALKDLCPGHYHLVFSHIGCEPIKIHMDLYEDSILEIGLEHTSITLSNVIIESDHADHHHHHNVTIRRKEIEDKAHISLSKLLENETGVHLIQNGSGISKPVVHGLYGNRLTILNNGIIQSGQQWGNDHSPEVDPFAADEITIIKGANALQYSGGNLGSLILVQPKRIANEPHLHGLLKYTHHTNGLGHRINARAEQNLPSIAYRFTGTYGKRGDAKTPDYFLNNTGGQELNFSVQLEKQFSEKFFIDFYASTFNTQLGILRGSHIGNLTDLQTALNQDQPFNTEPDFSYTIEAPKQDVAHHLAKIKTRYYISDNQKIQFTLAGQINNRKEFDVRRSGRTDIPSLSLLQYTINGEMEYVKETDNDWELVAGTQSIFTDNTNDPATGILPLIPDYLSWKQGLFTTVSKKISKIYLTGGVRYDYEFQDVATISNSIPREIIRYENNFHNLTAILSLQSGLGSTQSISFNSGYALRNPGINERYSNGLHQGVSGIEEGNQDIRKEGSIKNTIGYDWLPTPNFSFNALVYHQYFKDYIFLNPQDETRLTIRGAFPVFRYEQTDATIHGFDLSTQYTINNTIIGKIKYSYIRGNDVERDIPLIYIPPNNVFTSLAYRTKQSNKISQNILLEEAQLEVSFKHVFEQTNLEADQDFLPPPPAYSLLNLQVSTDVNIKNNKLRLHLNCENLLNTSYRDYLNRQRYFADDLGRNFTFGVSLKF